MELILSDKLPCILQSDANATLHNNQLTFFDKFHNIHLSQKSFIHRIGLLLENMDPVGHYAIPEVGTLVHVPGGVLTKPQHCFSRLVVVAKNPVEMAMFRSRSTFSLVEVHNHLHVCVRVYLARAERGEMGADESGLEGASEEEWSEEEGVAGQVVKKRRLNTIAIE